MRGYRWRTLSYRLEIWTRLEGDNTQALNIENQSELMRSGPLDEEDRSNARQPSLTMQ